MAAAVQCAVHRALGFDAGACGCVVQGGNQGDHLCIVLAAFDGHRCLCRGRQPLRCAQAVADAVAQLQPLQTGAGQDDGVVIAGIELAQARIDVAAQVARLQVRAQGAQLGLSAQRRGADAGALRQCVERGVMVGDEGIGRIGAEQDRRQRERRFQFHRHVLERMHRAIGFAAHHRQLQFLQEQALAADGGQRAVQHFVTAGAHRHQLHGQPGMGLTQAVGDVFALPQGKRALSGSDAQDGHARIIAVAGAAVTAGPVRSSGWPRSGG
ncbi:hypothetical protein D3C81_1312590 [compost metagenome]